MKTTMLETRLFGGVQYWTPFEPFAHRKDKHRNGWEVHYHKLGIRTKFMDKKLWVHMADDLAAYDRDIPAVEKSSFSKHKK